MRCTLEIKLHAYARSLNSTGNNARGALLSHAGRTCALPQRHAPAKRCTRASGKVRRRSHPLDPQLRQLDVRLCKVGEEALLVVGVALDDGAQAGRVGQHVVGGDACGAGGRVVMGSGPPAACAPRMLVPPAATACPCGAPARPGPTQRPAGCWLFWISKTINAAHRCGPPSPWTRAPRACPAASRSRCCQTPPGRRTPCCPAARMHCKAAQAGGEEDRGSAGGGRVWCMPVGAAQPGAGTCALPPPAWPKGGGGPAHRVAARQHDELVWRQALGSKVSHLCVGGVWVVVTWVGWGLGSERERQAVAAAKGVKSGSARARRQPEPACSAEHSARAAAAATGQAQPPPPLPPRAAPHRTCSSADAVCSGMRPSGSGPAASRRPTASWMLGPPVMRTAYAPASAIRSAFDTTPSAGVPCSRLAAASITFLRRWVGRDGWAGMGRVMQGAEPGGHASSHQLRLGSGNMHVPPPPATHSPISAQPQPPSHSRASAPAALEAKVVGAFQLVLDGGVQAAVPRGRAVGAGVVEDESHHDGGLRAGGWWQVSAAALGGKGARSAHGAITGMLAASPKFQKASSASHTLDLGSTSLKAASTAAACSGVSRRGPPVAAAAGGTPPPPGKRSSWSSRGAATAAPSTPRLLGCGCGWVPAAAGRTVGVSRCLGPATCGDRRHIVQCTAPA